jgi:hypothetical protein
MKIRKAGKAMGKGTKGLVIIACMILLIIGYYAYLSNRNINEKEEVVSLTMTQEVLLRDLEKSYPPSPKEVMKYYSDMTMCFYNEEHTEEELEALANKARELYDDELLENQTEEQYQRMLAGDIDEYIKEKMTISSYSVANSTDVEYYTRDNYEWAKIYCVYTLRKEMELASIKEDFLLRKDKNQHWKIYGWILSPEENTNLE